MAPKYLETVCLTFFPTFIFVSSAFHHLLQSSTNIVNKVKKKHHIELLVTVLYMLVSTRQLSDTM